MSRIEIAGLGAVSPAGWGVPALRDCLAMGEALPVQPLARPGWTIPLRVHAVPSPAVKPAFLSHARLRRASPLTHYAVSAGLEALGDDVERVRRGEIRLATVAATMTGGISYSRRFYEEAIENPAVASPLVFPETVFNAPASHLSAYLGTAIVNYTLVGDSGAFLQAIALAAQWLEDDVADGCLVIGAEELDWTAADALRLFNRTSVLGAGAGALYLKRDQEVKSAVELAAVTDSHTSNLRNDGGDSLVKMRGQLPAGGTGELLCSSDSGEAVWPGWPGTRLAIKAVLGEAFVASAAWQCVASCDALQSCQYAAANVMVTGVGQQSIGARFVNTTLMRTESIAGK